MPARKGVVRLAAVFSVCGVHCGLQRSVQFTPFSANGQCHAPAGAAWRREGRADEVLGWAAAGVQAQALAAMAARSSHSTLGDDLRGRALSISTSPSMSGALRSQCSVTMYAPFQLVGVAGQQRVPCAHALLMRCSCAAHALLTHHPLVDTL